MVIDLIDYVIKAGSGILITYSKDGIESNTFYLRSVVYSPKYGKNYIVGYCQEYDSELTFRVDKIIDADVEWIDVFPPEYCVKQDGLYLVTCRSDMHLEFELRKYNKGENMLDYYHNEKGFESCYSDEDILAYHYIPYFKEVDNKTWFPISKELEDDNVHFVTFAYKLIDETVMEYDEEEVNYLCLPSIYELCNTNANGIFYTLDLIKKPIGELVKSNNVEVFAYNCCSEYTEVDHGNHWDLARKMGIVK